jgi:hypothetical protein
MSLLPESSCPLLTILSLSPSHPTLIISQCNPIKASFAISNIISMDCKDMEENGTGMRTRSFRDEDYINRRAFLRSYPLYHGAEDETTNEEMIGATNKETEKKPIKRMIISVTHWGEGKVLVLRKFKHKIQVYIIACMPFSFKPPTALISV